MDITASTTKRVAQVQVKKVSKTSQVAFLIGIAK